MIPRCITVKLLKISDKEKLSQVIGGESCCYKAIKAKVTSDFLPETMQAKRQWKEIFKVLKEQVTLEFFYKKKCSEMNVKYLFTHKTAEKNLSTTDK